jgi:hypothetical protein
MLTIQDESGENKKTFNPKVGLQLPEKSGVPRNLNRSQEEAINRLEIPRDQYRALFARLDAWAKDDEARDPMTWATAIEEAWNAIKPKAVEPEFNRQQASQYDQAIDLHLAELKKRPAPMPVPSTSRDIAVHTPLGQRIGLTREIWRLLLEMIGEMRRVEGRAVFTNPRDIVVLTRVSTAMRQLVLEQLATQFGVDLGKIGSGALAAIHPHSHFTRSYPGIAQLGVHLLEAYPPTRYVYLVPGASLLPVAVYMQTQAAGVEVVNMPISGLSEDAMQRNPRKFEVNRFAPFYHFYLRKFVAPTDAFEPDKPPKQMTPRRKFLLMDYSSSGTTVRIVRGQIVEYLASLGIQNAARYVESFEFGGRFVEGLQRSESNKPPGESITSSQTIEALETFRVALKNERLKELNLVLYDKPKSGADFTGSLEDRDRQGVNVERLMTLWIAVRDAIAKSRSQGAVSENERM